MSGSSEIAGEKAMKAPTPYKGAHCNGRLCNII